MHPERTVSDMDFPERLSTLRRERGLTQNALAESTSIHVSQLKRYEAATSQPTLEVIRRLAIALSVSADLLIFDKDERGPDDDLRLQFEAIVKFSQPEKQVAKAVLEGLILKHEAARWAEKPAAP